MVKHTIYWYYFKRQAFSSDHFLCWLKHILKVTAYKEGHNVLGVLCKKSSEQIKCPFMWAVQMLS